MEPKFELTEANFRRIKGFIPEYSYVDHMPLFKNRQTLKGTFDLFLDEIKTNFPDGVDYIVGVEFGGAMYAAFLAYHLGVGLVIVRKKGKLPGPTFSCKYTHGYDKGEYELQVDALEPGSKVIIIDDLLSTGGTLRACCDLLHKADANILGCMVAIEKPAGAGRENIELDYGDIKLFSLVQLTFRGNKPVFDPADLEQEKKDYQEFLKSLWKDGKTVEEASKGTAGIAA